MIPFVSITSVCICSVSLPSHRCSAAQGRQAFIRIAHGRRRERRPWQGGAAAEDRLAMMSLRRCLAVSHKLQGDE